MPLPPMIADQPCLLWDWRAAEHFQEGIASGR
jgi:hypothetical protein